ncbi:MAG: hypothetical protein GY719_20045 [bacterium]|nr:hypothetical protein [bacterium]
MTRPYPYSFEAMAFSVIMLLAAGVTWVGLTAPGGGLKASTTGIIMLVVSPFFIAQGLRRKAVVKTERLDGKAWYWFGLCCFWALLAGVASSSLETVQTLSRLIFFVLAMFCLVMAIDLERSKARPEQR